MLASRNAETVRSLIIETRIERDGRTLFAGEIALSELHRGLDDLIAYLARDNVFPDGAVLLTGTGIVPPDDVALRSGDVVTIAAAGIGELRNPMRACQDAFQRRR